MTSIGTTAEQAEWMSDKVRSALLARTKTGAFATAIPVAGHTIVGREVDKEDGVTVVSGVYSYVQRIILHVTTPDT
ncbi:hypothetical protein ABT095_34580 [Kitasatospora sp. NPDC002227]|uniref:hypothetical protein n=1 Tax=Kitasatospora sp. NPDC002227 TaxID=3154773 RepID=UPI00331E4B6B